MAARACRDDGQWFAYAMTSQAEDGELIVRNLKSGQEFSQPRGTAPQFTPDGKFVMFTIVPPRPENEANAAGRAGERGGTGGGRGASRRRGGSRPAESQFARHHGAARRAGDDRRADRELPAAD